MSYQYHTVMVLFQVYSQTATLFSEDQLNELSVANMEERATLHTLVRNVE